MGFLVKVLIRMLLVGSCGFIFFYGTFFAVEHYSTNDQMLTQELCFSFPAEYQGNGVYWRAFAREQEQALLEIAKQNIGQLAGYCSVQARSEEPRLIFCLRCPGDVRAKVTDSFNKVINTYIFRRSKVEEDLDRGTDYSPGTRTMSDFLARGELEKLRKYNQAYIRKKQEFSEVEIEYQRLQFENVDLKDQLVRDAMQTPRGAFADFIQSELEKACAADVVLKNSLGDINNIRRKIDDINFHLSHGKLANQEGSLLLQRMQNEQCRKQLQATIHLRRTLLTENIKQRRWPEFELELKKRITWNAQLVKENRNQQDVLTRQLGQLGAQIAAIRPSMVRQAESTPEADFMTISARLESNLVHFSKSYPLSNSQKLVLAEAVLLGGLIGLLIPMSRRPRRESDVIAPVQSVEAPVVIESIAVPVAIESVVASVVAEPVVMPVVVEPPKEVPKKKREKKKKKKDKKAKEPPVSLEESRTIPPTEPTKKPDTEVITINLERDHPMTAFSEGSAKNAQESGYGSFSNLVGQIKENLSSPIILLGAAGGQEGAARCAVNLAITLTGRGERVLIIEADHTARDLEAIFELSKKAGFFEWRRGDAWVSHTTHKTQLVGLTVMPAGMPNEEQLDPEMDLSKEAHRWANLRNLFDVILLYSPAALAENAPDAARIVTQQQLDLADAVLVLTRSRKKGPQAYAALSSRAASAVEGHKAQFMGVIVVET